MSQVLAFPGGYNPRDARGMAIEFAARCAANDFGTIKSAILVFDTPNGLRVMTAGAEAQCGYRQIGMLEAAKMSVFADGDEE